MPFKCDGNKEVLCIPGTSPSDCLVPYPGHSLRGSYPSAEKQSVNSTAPADWAIYECVCVYIYIYIYMCVCLFVCVCVYIHIYIWFLWEKRGSSLTNNKATVKATLPGEVN